MIRFNVTDSTPLIEFDVQSNVLNMSAEDVRPVTVKDYNQLNNKPSIEGVTLEGDISLDDIGVTTPLVGNSDDVTPAMVVEALASGRSVILTTEQTFIGMTETFRLQMTVGGDHSYALGTGVFNYEGTPYAITLMGTIYSTGWEWNVTRLALPDEIPNPYGSPPPMDGQGSSGTLSSGYALGNHQHPSDLSRMIAEYVVPYYSTAQAYSIGDLVVSPWTGKLFRAIANTTPKPAIGSDWWEEVVLINEVQRKLTEGDNISLANDTVSVTGIVPKAALTNGIPFGQVDSTSTATEYTATVPGINQLKDGVCVLLKNGVVTSATGFTININGLGAKPSYTNLAAATRDTTIFNINYTMLFVYDEDRVSGGCWICYRGYDANTNTIGYQLRTNNSTLHAADKGYRYRLWFTSADGSKWVPANKSTATDATTSRTPNTTPINPFGPIVYNSTNGTVNANANLPAATLWQQYTLTVGYSFNEPNGAMTFPAPVYLKCTPQTNGSAVMVELVQSLPSTNDGYIYILLGRAYSATAMELIADHPVFYHDGTAIRLWTGAASSGGVTSFNGQTGDVTYTAPVSSVNGQTGAVTLAIPTKVSDLTNDSGFLTLGTLPIYDGSVV